MKSRNIFCIIGAIVTAVAAVAGIAYLVYRFIERKECLCEDYDCFDDCYCDDDCCDDDCCDDGCCDCGNESDGETEE